MVTLTINIPAGY